MIVTSICIQCSQEFEYESFDSPIMDHAFKMLATGLCDTCELAAIKKQELEANREREREKVRRIQERKVYIIPSRFLLTRESHPDFNVELNRVVLEWKPTDDKPWFGVIGPTGTCKSRCLSKLLERFIDEGKRCEFVAAADFGDLAIQQYLDQHKTASISKLRSLKRADVLLLDDLGKMKPTPAKEDELFKLLDTRMAMNRPLLWNANLSLQEFTAGYSKEHRDPIVGRLLDASVIIEVSGGANE